MLYNSQGQVHKTSLPYMSGDPEYTTHYYDSRGRRVSEVRADGGSTDTVYDTATGTNGRTQLRVTTTETVLDAAGMVADLHKKESYFELGERLVQTVDAAGATESVTTTYEYDALGNVVTTTVDGGDDGTTESSAKYDDAGHRISFTDPNAGEVISSYTALGELSTITDNKGVTTTFAYDKLGRMTSRATQDRTDEWHYDRAGALGLLDYTTNNDGFTQTYFYEDHELKAHLRRIETESTVPGFGTQTFVDSMTYDSDGRLDTLTSPSGYAVTQHYNQYGYFTGVSHDGSDLHTITTMGPFGVLTDTLGGIARTRGYDETSGRLTSITSSKQDLSYGWRSNGSLETRTKGDAVDTFAYDSHERLTTTTTAVNLVNQRTLTQTYDRLGNIESKTSSRSGDLQVTDYGYATGGSTRPHAVSEATLNGAANNFEYDANGALTHYDAPGSDQDKYIAYNSVNQPIKITVGTSLDDVNPVARDEFLYSPDGARYYKKSTYDDNGVQRIEHTFYIGNYETTYYDALSDVEQVEKTRVGSGILYVSTTHQDGTVENATQALHRDHLGSVDVVTTVADGSLLADLEFEPFGERRDSGMTRNLIGAQRTNVLLGLKTSTSRGFTDHEHLARTGLIHMNGRVYDPQLGRFLSPDPIVQAPTYSQNWNRYSYVYNNPLRYTDPSGYQSVSCIGDDGVDCSRHPSDEKMQRQRRLELNSMRLRSGQRAMQFSRLGSGGSASRSSVPFRMNTSGSSAEVMAFSNTAFGSGPHDGNNILGALGLSANATGLATAEAAMHQMAGKVVLDDGRVVSLKYYGNKFDFADMIAAAKAGQLQLAKINSGVSAFGTAVTYLSVGSDTYAYLTGRMSGVRFTYNSVGNAATLGIAALGSGGTAAIVGISWYVAGEAFVPMVHGINHAYDQLRQGARDASMWGAFDFGADR